MIHMASSLGWTCGLCHLDEKMSTEMLASSFWQEWPASINQLIKVVLQSLRFLPNTVNLESFGSFCCRWRCTAEVCILLPRSLGQDAPETLRSFADLRQHSALRFSHYEEEEIGLDEPIHACERDVHLSFESHVPRWCFVIDPVQAPPRSRRPKGRTTIKGTKCSFRRAGGYPKFNLD